MCAKRASPRAPHRLKRETVDCFINEKRAIRQGYKRNCIHTDMDITETRQEYKWKSDGQKRDHLNPTVFALTRI